VHQLLSSTNAIKTKRQAVALAGLTPGKPCITGISVSNGISACDKLIDSHTSWGELIAVAFKKSIWDSSSVGTQTLSKIWAQIYTIQLISGDDLPLQGKHTAGWEIGMWNSNSLQELTLSSIG
jgi:hypothetical protein